MLVVVVLALIVRARSIRTSVPRDGVPVLAFKLLVGFALILELDFLLPTEAAPFLLATISLVAVFVLEMVCRQGCSVDGSTLAGGNEPLQLLGWFLTYVQGLVCVLRSAFGSGYCFTSGCYVTD